MRSLLLVPATDRAALDRSFGSGADVIVVDLVEAGPAGPEAARDTMAAFVATHAGLPSRPALHVRIHGFASGLADRDLDAAVAAGADGLVLPRAEGGVDVTRLDAKIAVAEAVHEVPDGRTRIIAAVGDGARAVFRAGTHHGASHRLAGLVWGLDDLAADLGIGRVTGDDGRLLDAFRLARASTLLGAVAAGVAPIDAVHRGDADDLASACRAAVKEGFTAKLANDPVQIATINAAFTPSPRAVEAAERIVGAFAAAAGGIVVLDGRVIDATELARARRLLARAATG